jgi:lysophospholipase L1-like esterase
VIWLTASISALVVLGALVLPRGNSATRPAPNRERDFYDRRARHAEVVELGRSSDVDLVFIGDSITHLFGGEPASGRAVAPDVWARHYGERRALNLGFGWDRTQNVLWRLANGELDHIRPRAAVVLIGTNNLVGSHSARRNTPDEIVEGVLAVCEEIRNRVPGCRVLVMGLLPRAPKRFIDPIRTTNRMLAEACRLQDIHFMDLWTSFADPDGLPRSHLMADTTHPNREGYRVWAEAIEPLIAEWLGAQEEL